MRRPISPTEWDKSAGRFKRWGISRPTEEEYMKALISWYSKQAESDIQYRELRAKIDPLIAIGGKEWKSDDGKAHRVYFNSYSLSMGYMLFEKQKEADLGKSWQLDGYFDVSSEKWIPARCSNLTPDEFKQIALEAARSLGFLQRPPEKTFACDGSEMQDGGLYIIVSERGAHWRGGKRSRLPLNIGRIVINHGRIKNLCTRKHEPAFEWKFPIAHKVRPASEESLKWQGRNLVVEFSELLIDSVCLLPVSDLNASRNLAPANKELA